MNRQMLLGYQWLIGVSDTATGALLMVAPRETLEMMHLHASDSDLPYLSYIGAFVLSVGMACLYGAYLLHRNRWAGRLETVWLLTAMTRASVAVLVTAQILAGTLEAGWLTVAIFDGACVAIQAAGLFRGWLAHAAR